MPNKFEQIKALMEQGKKPKEIAEALGITLSYSHTSMTAMRAGFRNPTEYNTYLVQQKGFRNRNEYGKYLADKKMADEESHLITKPLEIISQEIDSNSATPTSYFRSKLDESLLEEIIKIMQELPQKQRDILQKRYFEGLTLKKVGKIYGVTKERIRQIEAKAIRYIKNKLSDSEYSVLHSPTFWENGHSIERKKAKNPRYTKHLKPTNLHPKPQ